ncbi:hypothetical protein GJ744_005949 [Endocarpon pusillum]|uniref:F-box domain-containing protein n=1 Tax=Endocarpon pusillum TaxID=364733 RepID=A0A8H7E547_9EURO|nr:hypothetical protein GJ744_005949 [Endocarpon pusillum]
MTLLSARTAALDSFFIGLPPLDMTDLQAHPTHTADSAAPALTLLSLPTEIRMCIYNMLFQQPFRVVLGEKSLLQEIDRTPQSSQLLETCHQLHDEAVSIAYRSINMHTTKSYSMLDLREVEEFEIVHYVEKLFVNNLDCTAFLDLGHLRRFPRLQCCEVNITFPMHDSDVYEECQCIQLRLLEAAKSFRYMNTTAAVSLHLHFQVGVRWADQDLAAQGKWRHIISLDVAKKLQNKTASTPSNDHNSGWDNFCFNITGDILSDSRY